MRRLGRLLLGLWVSVTLSGVPLGHGCPTEGPAARAEAGASTTEVAHAAHAAHGSQASHGSHAPASDDHATDCECVGDCCAVTVVSLPQAEVAVVATFRLQAPASLSVATPEESVAPSLGLPFATAPPTVSTT